MYLQGLGKLRLNEVVIPGSHDAGIYEEGKSNVRTQTLSIFKQACAGCRFFDLRIALQSKKDSGEYEHRAYHLKPSFVDSLEVKGGAKVRTSQWNESASRWADSHSVANTYQKKIKSLGGWGGGLTTILMEAAEFLWSCPSEFLILKFAKCYNWADIAKTCIDVIPPRLQYQGPYPTNLNMMTVKQLAGKVITVFETDSSDLPQHPSILGFKSLFTKKGGGAPKQYDIQYHGMQAFGKYSSTEKVSENTRKQQELLTGYATTVSKLAIGMMYWTTTAAFGNILERNEKMWTPENRQALRTTWKAGLGAAIEACIGNELAIARRYGSYVGGRAKAFMPNIIMMDDVSKDKCDDIRELNYVGDHELNAMVHLVNEAVRGQPLIQMPDLPKLPSQMAPLSKAQTDKF